MCDFQDHNTSLMIFEDILDVRDTKDVEKKVVVK